CDNPYVLDLYQDRKVLLSLIYLLTDIDQAHKDYHTMMREVLNNSSRMIMTILDRRAVESGSITLHFEEVVINDILRDLIGNYKKLAGEKGIQIVCDFKNKVKLSLDRNYISQVIDNLISNAVKFSPRGRKIYINSYDTKEEVIFEVIDEGEGINEKDSELIFEKYRKSDAKPTANEASSGLGLAIAKKFVEAMNGTIHGENEPNKGAKFVVEFPLKKG
ncbi:MAG: HAMP domain-containing sensor histidine kinase, partial [Bacteroidota bacterium]